MDNIWVSKNYFSTKGKLIGKNYDIFVLLLSFITSTFVSYI